MTRASYSTTPLLRSLVHRPQGVILVISYVILYHVISYVILFANLIKPEQSNIWNLTWLLTSSMTSHTVVGNVTDRAIECRLNFGNRFSSLGYNKRYAPPPITECAWLAEIQWSAGLNKYIRLFCDSPYLCRWWKGLFYRGWQDSHRAAGAHSQGRAPLSDLKKTLFSGFLPLNYVICIFAACVLKLFAMREDRWSLQHGKELTKGLFFAPFWPLYMGMNGYMGLFSPPPPPWENPGCATVGQCRVLVISNCHTALICLIVGQVEKWRTWFVHCSYCFCYCDDKTNSNRYFSLKPAVSDVDKNMIVTGVRWDFMRTARARAILGCFIKGRVPPSWHIMLFTFFFFATATPSQCFPVLHFPIFRPWNTNSQTCTFLPS